VIPSNSKAISGTVTESGYLAIASSEVDSAEKGKVYRWSHLFEAVPITTQNVRYIHFIPQGASLHGSLSASVYGDKVKIELFITPTTSEDGTKINTYNFNQSLGDADADDYVLIYHTPTLSLDGTKYGPDTIVFSSGGNPAATKIAGSVSESIDTIIDPDKIYLWKITNIGSTGTTDVFIQGIVKVGV